jgi:RNA polymerase sigma factor (sigma-70 family)
MVRMCVVGRKRRREVLVAPDSLERWSKAASGESVDTDQRAESHEQLVELLRDLVESGLTATQRRVVELYFFQGQPQDQIATDLGISQQSVSRHLYGAVRDGQKVGGAIRRLQKLFAELGIEWV